MKKMKKMIQRIVEMKMKKMVSENQERDAQTR